MTDVWTKKKKFLFTILHLSAVIFYLCALRGVVYLMGMVYIKGCGVLISEPISRKLMCNTLIKYCIALHNQVLDSTPLLYFLAWLQLPSKLWSTLSAAYLTNWFVK